MSTHAEPQGIILIIDEDENVVVPLTFHFDNLGFEVISANSGELGLRQAIERRPNLVLLSAALPDMSGLEIFRRLRTAPLTSHIPVIFIASRHDPIRPNQLLAAGADDVISKPFDIDILALRVRNAIQRTRREGLIEPRTGLPTGPLIAEKIAEVENAQDWCRLDLTITDFDAFRDRYDFLAGNEVLRFVANAVCEIVAEMGTPDDFVGHYGDTRLVVLTERARGPALRDALKVSLNEGLRQFYTFMEREQGYVLVDDGLGGQAPRPLMSASITLRDGVKGEHAAEG